MLTKFFVYLRIGPVLFAGLEYALLVGGFAFIALAVVASLYIPVDDEMRYGDPSAWRRESQTLTAAAGGDDDCGGAPTVRVPMPAAVKELTTYYDSLLDGGNAARLNDDLCSRLDVVHEVRTPADSRTESECDDFDDDDDDDGRQMAV